MTNSTEAAQMRVLDGLAVLQDKLGDEGQSFRAKAVKDAEDLILSLRRQLAEAEEQNAIRKAAAVEAEAQHAYEVEQLEARATTAERRLADAANAIPDVSGPVDERIRVLRQHHADQLTASQQEVARLREALDTIGMAERGDEETPAAFALRLTRLALATLSTPQQGEEQGAG